MTPAPCLFSKSFPSCKNLLYEFVSMKVYENSLINKFLLSPKNKEKRKKNIVLVVFPEKTNNDLSYQCQNDDTDKRCENSYPCNECVGSTLGCCIT